MQAPLQIAFHNVESSESIKGLIEDKVAWLERFYDRITGCRVVVEGPHQRPPRGGHPGYQVRIDLLVPGGEIVVNREPARNDSRDPAAAVRGAFDIARRRVEEYARRLRSEVKAHEPPPLARVSRLFPEEGYGFLTTPEGREVYFHQNAVNGDFGRLQVGASVTFSEADGDKGPQASVVRLA